MLCGPGNNGGDGYVIARWLKQRGADVAVVAAFDPKTDSALQARADFGGEVLENHDRRSAGTFVDCLFGSGQDRALSDELAALVSHLRQRHDRSIAIDLPSGVSSDSGTLLNPVAPYHLTIALGAWKWAHWSMPSAKVMGERRLVDIGLEVPESAASLIGKPKLKAPPPDAHKYTRGLVAVVAGDMPGASALAARAAQYGGAGYVKLLCDEAAPTLPASLVVDPRPLPEALSDTRIAAIVVGPGLGRGTDAAKRLQAVLEADTQAALVIDADALHLLGERAALPRGRKIVLTPHEGELAALQEAYGTDSSSSAAGPAKLVAAQRVASAAGAVVIAKGADTVIVAPDGNVRAAPPASSWLSTAGTGDVLAGLVASRLAAGTDAMDAAAEAVWLHSEAARQCGPVFTADGLVERLPDAYASAQ